MNEKGVSEALQLAIFGWSSRKMIKRYSHLGTPAKREAMNSLSVNFPAKTGDMSISVAVPKDSPKESTLTPVM